MAKRKLRAARAAYPSDVTDAQWAVIAPLIPPAEPGGRARGVDMHEVFNGIIYVLRSGCSWRMLPHDLPPWGTVHDYYRRFRRDGHLTQSARPAARQGAPGRGPPGPTPCGDPGQPVGQDDKKRGPERGYDAVKKVNGRKRHLLVDPLGLILAVLVHAGYNAKDWLGWVEATLGWTVEVVRKPRRWGWYPVGVTPPPMPAFTVVKRRWIVERTFAWLDGYRRLSKDYEYLAESREAFDPSSHDQPHGSPP